MISIEEDAVNTHSITHMMTSKDPADQRKHTCTIHVLQNPNEESGTNPIFAVSCKGIYPEDNSEVVHKFVLSQVGFENLIVAYEELMNNPEKYKHG